MTLAPGKPLRVAFGETVAELGKTDPRIVVLDGDLGSSTRADIFENAHPDRFFQMGIAEQNLLGAAAGMATVGFIPFVSTFACFAVARALDSIRVLIAQPKLNVKIVGGYSGLLAGMTGKTHLIFDDIAIMRAMAGMVTVVPADEVETRQAIRAITAYRGPVYLRLTRQASPVLFDDTYNFELGRVAVVRSGGDVTVFATGTQTVRAFEAAEILAREGIDVHLVHVPTLKPLDAEGIVQAAQATGFVITSEEGSIIGGLGGAVAEVLGDRFPVTVKRHGLADIFGESGPDQALLEKYGLSVTKTAEAIRAFVHARKA
ncbi:MAG: transketolase C-terminal domain-containing protein [Actinomycetota bacterium]